MGTVMRSRWIESAGSKCAIVSDLEGMVQWELQRKGVFRQVKEQREGISGTVMRGPGIPRARWKRSPFSIQIGPATKAVLSALISPTFLYMGFILYPFKQLFKTITL